MDNNNFQRKGVKSNTEAGKIFEKIIYNFCNYSPQKIYKKIDITHCLKKFKCDRILSGGKNDRFRNN